MTGMQTFRADCRWHLPCAILLVAAQAACAGRVNPPLDAPSEAARHRAALASIVVVNATTSPLTIAFRSATPPLQEVIIGRVAAGLRAALAPVPAGEPIILVAKKPDGSELQLAARSFELDAEWTWQIAGDAAFVRPTAK